jgi:hypothetical protein
MDEIDFNIEMRKLKECFPTGFTEGKMAVIFEKTRHLAASDFSRLVEKLIISCKHPPSVAEILEHANAYRNFRVFSQPDVRSARRSCGTCEDGIVFAERTDMNSAPYVFKCNCDAGQRREEQYPIWSAAFAARFRDLKKMKFIASVRTKETKEEYTVLKSEEGTLFHLSKCESKFRQSPDGHWERVED